MERAHFKCLLWKALWGLSAASLVSAWIAANNGQVLGMDAQHLFLDALVFAVLSIPIKLDCHACNVCKIS